MFHNPNSILLVSPTKRPAKHQNPDDPPKFSSDWKSIASNLLCSTNGDAAVIRDSLQETDASAHWIVLTVRGRASWWYTLGDTFENTDCGFYEVVWKGLKKTKENCNQKGQDIIDNWVNYGGLPKEILTNIKKGIDMYINTFSGLIVVCILRSHQLWIGVQFSHYLGSWSLVPCPNLDNK